jgi:hypothetical protein
MNIRDATATDVEVLFAIRCSVKENHMSREQLAAAGIALESLSRMIADGDHVTPIIEEDGHPVAFSMARVSDSYVFPPVSESAKRIFNRRHAV